MFVVVAFVLVVERMLVVELQKFVLKIVFAVLVELLVFVELELP